jgi:hypothetical protein
MPNMCLNSKLSDSSSITKSGEKKDFTLGMQQSFAEWIAQGL